MRISDWSSDVCSSDLSVPSAAPASRAARRWPGGAMAAASAPPRRIWVRESIARMLAAPMAAPCLTHTQSPARHNARRSEEHTSELQSLMRISYAVFCLKKKKEYHTAYNNIQQHTKQNIYTTQYRT